MQPSIPLIMPSDESAPSRLNMTLGSSTNTEADGIFGWYRYIQDFTGDFALHWIQRLASTDDVLWEPFAGSGTSLVAAKMLGIESVGYDMNPFMVDVARTKTNWEIDPDDIDRHAEQLIFQLAKARVEEPLSPVKVKWSEYDHEHSVAHVSEDAKLSKWIAPIVLQRFQTVVGEVNRLPEPYRSFFRLAAASILIPASNMTFRPNICYESKATIDFPVVGALESRIRQMIKDYREVHSASSTKSSVHVGDARSVAPSGATFIFTSPPYPNDMEYIHQTRLELAIFDHVNDRIGLTNLKKRMISSSVKLVYRDNDWQRTSGLEVEGVASSCAAIAKTLEGRNWGWNAADMTAQFFGGMRAVLENWRRNLEPGALAAVVIGDSAFNGVKVETDRLLAETAVLHGFECEGIEAFRSRWNTKHNIELRECVVLLRRGERSI